MTISSEQSKASSAHIVYTAKQDHCSVLEKLVNAAGDSYCHGGRAWHRRRRGGQMPSHKQSVYTSVSFVRRQGLGRLTCYANFETPAGSWVFAASQSGDKRE
jgi:hypothetical protein